MKLALIDGDLISYPCACTAENDPQDIAEIRCDDLVRKILKDTNSLDYKIFLTGSNNFRYDIYPEYKGNRVGKPRPKWLEACREYLVKYWNASITDGNEADDELGIAQTHEELNSVICSFDKDLLQVPGHHYNWRTGVERFISPFDGLRIFYGQLIAGDGSDNVPSYDGKVRGNVPKFIQKLQEPLQVMTEEWDMYKYVQSIYQTEHMIRNARCLWVQRREEDIWNGPQLENTALSSQFCEEELDDGLLNMNA